MGVAHFIHCIEIVIDFAGTHRLVFRSVLATVMMLSNMVIGGLLCVLIRFDFTSL